MVSIVLDALMCYQRGTSTTTPPIFVVTVAYGSLVHGTMAWSRQERGTLTLVLLPP